MNCRMDKEAYLQSPCRAASIPYWKANSIAVPPDMRIVHEADFDDILLEEYEDVPYFRLMHTLERMEKPVLPEKFRLHEAEDAALAAHINACYGAECVDAQEIKKWRPRKVYCKNLWLTVYDEKTGKIAASGIAEIDQEIGEGALEWIQVTEEYRRRGLGRFIVLELLNRMADKVQFVTVSGEINHAAQVEKLYRACGFAGNDVWHVLCRKEKI